MGSLNCNCSNISKEETILASNLISDLEEIIEFQPNPKTFLQVPNNQEVSHTTIPTDNTQPELQGELFRLQKTLKETLIPRWCVLSNKTLKYYKNQYSAYCKEKPLFEIPVSKILSCRSYKKSNRFYLDLSFHRQSVIAGVLSDPFKSLSESNSKKDSKNSSFLSVQLPDLQIEPETLTFVAPDRADWENWSKSLLSCIKSPIMH